MDTENLLNQVFSITQKYNAIAEITGENFNIFNILRIESSEVGTHSAFLAELLNPKGSHGQKDNFLKEFIKVFGVSNFNEEDTADSIIHVEKHIDKINKDYTTGGRVDIVVESVSGKFIVIENKIYAYDQFNWLERYKNAYPKADIIYLTLNGNHPAKNSIGNLKETEYKCESYSVSIIKWLENCREKSVMLPMLRECINQYINLIKKLTHQSSSKIQEMEINKLLIESQEKFETAEYIASALENLKSIRSTCQIELIATWENEYGGLTIELFNYNEYIFYIKPSSENKYLHFDLFPQLNQSMGCADNQDVETFRILAKKFDSRPVDTEHFYSNKNYTVWVKSKSEKPNLKYENYKKMNTDRAEWINAVMEEGKEFIIHMVNGLKEMNNLDIKINHRFL